MRAPSSGSRSVGSALLALALALCLTPLAATPASSSSPRPSDPRLASLQLDALSAGSSIRDGVLRPQRLAELRRSSWGGPVTAPDGEIVSVYVSDAYPVDPSLQQQTADLLSQLYHDDELSSVTVYLAPLSEVESTCSGADAVGCYSHGRIVATADPLPDGSSPANVIAHEYGHHIAANRNNAPWDAILWGPKRWASAAHVCTRVVTGTAFPGDEGSHYRLNPGEAWAETYRLLNYEKQAWPNWILSPWSVVDPSFSPDAAELAAAREDVLRPWRRRAFVSWSGKLRAVERQGKSHVVRARRTIATPLDGDVAFIVPRGPAGMYLSVSTVGGRVLGGTYVRILPIRVCGERRLVLTVQAAKPGPFRVSYSVP